MTTMIALLLTAGGAASAVAASSLPVMPHTTPTSVMPHI